MDSDEEKKIKFIPPIPAKYIDIQLEFDVSKLEELFDEHNKTTNGEEV